MTDHSINRLALATALWAAFGCAPAEREPSDTPHPPRLKSGVVTCEPGRGDCDGDATNGCETDLDSDSAHCGSCGASCALLNVASALCVAAHCKIDVCASDFGDCDGVAANGCEGHVCYTSHGPDCRAKCEKPAYGYEF